MFPFHKLKLELQGLSHAKEMTLIVKNLPKGIKVDYEEINTLLRRRRPKTISETTRIENDNYEIIGLDRGITAGDDIIIKVANTNIKENDYDLNYMRPSHVDYILYDKGKLVSGGGSSSGRLTVLFTILAGIIKPILNNLSIYIGSVITKIAGCDYKYQYLDHISIDEIKHLNQMDYPSLDYDFLNYVNSLDLNDSYGGSITTFIKGFPKNIGNSYVNSLKSYFSSSILLIPAIKGVSFGLGSEYSNQNGSMVLDNLAYQGDEVIYLHNFNGGLIGGMSNGCDIIINSIIKPTPTISKQVSTINVKEKKNVEHQFNGRHDKCLVSRIIPVIESMLIIAVYDILLDEGIIHA